MSITAEVIVELYAKYQLFSYWQNVGIVLAIVFGIMTIFSLGFSAMTEGSILTNVICAFIMAIFITGIVIVFHYTYLIDVVLKPEIARYVVPVGLDIADKVSQEVSEIWSILKGVLAK